MTVPAITKSLPLHGCAANGMQLELFATMSPHLTSLLNWLEVIPRKREMFCSMESLFGKHVLFDSSFTLNKFSVTHGGMKKMPKSSAECSDTTQPIL